MIRAVAVFALSAWLVLVLYLPSATPAERFLAVMREEHQAVAALWGWAPAEQILNRAARLQEATSNVTPIPSLVVAPPTEALPGAVGQEMAAVNLRLFHNGYFRAVDALFLLAAYRLAALLQWLPALAPFGLACLGDAWLQRQVRSRELRSGQPERFALLASASIALACATGLGLVWPGAISPLVWPAAATLVALSAVRAWGWFKG